MTEPETSAPQPVHRSAAGAAGAAVGRGADRGMERLLHVQRPVVLGHVRSIRRQRPDASPDEIIRILERRYLATITSTGAATGAASAIPAIGTVAGLALSSGEIVLALEASALFVQSVAEVHGIAVNDPGRARTLVMAVVLGEAGRQAVMDVVRTAQGRPSAKGERLGGMIGQSMPAPVIDLATAQLQKLLGRLAARQGASVLGRMVPFGIGAVIGGGANFMLGRGVIASSRAAFDTAPAILPAWLEPIEKAPRVKREQREKPEKPRKALRPRKERPARTPRPPRATRGEAQSSIES